MLDQDFANQQKQKLEEEKKKLEESLSVFAKKDPTLKGDWDTKYPNMGAGDSRETGDEALEIEADESESYAATLPVEFELELKLQQVNRALEHIKSGDYGICSSCKQEIPKERLEVIPETNICLECKSKQ